MAEQLFVYGTLQRPDVQQQVIGRIISGTPATLPGYTLLHHVYPMALPQAGAQIEGVLLDLTLQELMHTDYYEGSAYVRVSESLTCGRTAWLYCGSPALERVLR